MLEQAPTATFTAVIPSVKGSLQALLAIGEKGVSLATEKMVLGSWSVGECRIFPVQGDRFRLEAEGETLTFFGDRPDALAGLVNRIWSLPVVDEPLAVTNHVAFGTALVRHAEVEPAQILIEVEQVQPAQVEVATQPTRPLSELIADRAARNPELVETIEPDTEAAGTPPPEIPEVSELVTSLTRLLLNLPRPAELWERIKGNRRVGIATGFAALLLVVVAVSSLLGPNGQAAAQPIETEGDPATGATTTTQAAAAEPVTPITAAQGLGLLESKPNQFAASWNRLVADLDDSLRLKVGGQSEWNITPFLSLSTVTDPFTGNIQSLVLTASPQGDPDADRAILVGLGAAIGAAEPSLPPSGRRDLIEALGLDVNRPELAGLDNVRTYGDLAYHLVYHPDRGTLHLTIASLGTCFEQLPVEDAASAGTDGGESDPATTVPASSC